MRLRQAGELRDVIFTIRASGALTNRVIRLGHYANSGCGSSIGYEPCRFGIVASRSIEISFSSGAFGLSMVITLVLLAFPAVRQLLIEIAGQVVQFRSAEWLSVALALYSAGGLTVQPSVWLRPNRDHAVVSTSGFCWTVVGLLALAMRRSWIAIRWANWVKVGYSLLAILAVGQVVGMSFDSLQLPPSVTVVKAALVTTGCCLSATLGVKSLRDGNSLLHLASVGLVVVAATHFRGFWRVAGRDADLGFNGMAHG